MSNGSTEPPDGSRIENGRTRPSLVDVEAILRALDAPPEPVAKASALARMANTVDNAHEPGIGAHSTGPCFGGVEVREVVGNEEMTTPKTTITGPVHLTAPPSEWPRR